ncbi:hypothetical protein [Reinekea blandensis]|uniref:Solute-binding protein family 3/N-terminal domain-containing protein n=1 Tax=Reinekea blandensis MED297 TaxID=314283 RepID=A4BDB7_9GAMM|nr:hypothetical protein [Reinekea blandensis]EAR09861.1 hypothetical protein MED297_05914 [Reinekea sp. MED297] [Reinekea blandensis MED297]
MRLITTLSRLFLLWPLLLCAETVDVYIPPDVLADYQVFLDGRDVTKIENYSGEGARRDVIEVVLFQQALARTGDRWDIRFVEQPDYGAMLDGLARGDVVASVTSLWRKDLTPRWDSLYMTTAVIERGQFEAGFYTPTVNNDALNSRTNPELRALRGVSSQNWVIDWRTLQSFGANVSHADTWGDMVTQVFAGDQDYLLAPFQPTPDLRLSLDQGDLIPIPNVKIALLGTRHYAISRTHPNGWDFNMSLHRGLMSLKKDGVVEQAFRDCGFLNPIAADWREVTYSDS